MCTKNLVKFCRMVTKITVSRHANRTNKRTYLSQYFPPIVVTKLLLYPVMVIITVDFILAC